MAVVEAKKAQAGQNPCPLLDENVDRFCMFPIKFPAIWEMYKKAEASFWTGAERGARARDARWLLHRACARNAQHARHAPSFTPSHTPHAYAKQRTQPRRSTWATTSATGTR